MESKCLKRKQSWLNSKTGWMKVNSKEVYYYLTKLHSSDIFLALLIPYDKSQVIRVVTVLIYLDCYVFVRVAA